VPPGSVERAPAGGPAEVLRFAAGLARREASSVRGTGALSRSQSPRCIDAAAGLGNLDKQGSRCDGSAPGRAPSLRTRQRRRGGE
jgi:hypothetical protein